MQHHDRDDTPPRTPSYLGQSHSRTASNASPAPSFRRRHTPTPSFMNYQNGAAARALTQPVQTPVLHSTPPASTKSRPARTLLLAFADVPPPSTVRTVERILKSQRVTTIAIFAGVRQEQTTKDLKIQLYSLIGQLQQEIGIQISLRQQWTDVEYQQAIESVDQISTAVCAPSYDSSDSSSSSSSTDILSVTEQDISELWQSTFAFLHTTAKAVIPRLAETGEDEKSMFAVTCASRSDASAAKICHAACESLLAQLSGQYAAQGVHVGPIEQLLPPERKAVAVKRERSIPDIDVPSRRHDVSHIGGGGMEGGESPTRLYEMWTMHEEFIP